MIRSIVVESPREIGFEEVEEPQLKPNQVRVKTLFSGVSHGTEMNVYRGSAAFIMKLTEDERAKAYPMKLGYAAVGEVIEVDKEVTKISKGDLVFGSGNHATSFVAEEKHISKLPTGIPSEVGVLTQNLRTAHNGILDASINLGEVVAIFGLGAIGQMMAQMAKLSGALCVIGVDLYPRRREIAQELGTDVVLNPEECEVNKEIKKLTANRGADVAIEVSGSYRALDEACRSVAKHASVVALSWYPGPAEGLWLGDDFHFNRIRIKCSQTGSIAPELSARWDYERRTETALRLLPTLKLKDLITHVMPFEKAPKAFELIDKHPEEVVQLVFKY